MERLLLYSRARHEKHSQTVPYYEPKWPVFIDTKEKKQYQKKPFGLNLFREDNALSFDCIAQHGQFFQNNFMWKITGIQLTVFINGNN